MGRLTPLVALTVALSTARFVSHTAGAEPPDPARRPNILLLLADDLRADALGGYGNPHVRTPHLDALARTGTTFRRAYVRHFSTMDLITPERRHGLIRQT